MIRDHIGRRMTVERRDLWNTLLALLIAQWLMLIGWQGQIDERQDERRTGWDRRRRVATAHPAIGET